MLQSVAISLVILWLDGASGQERVEQSSPSLDIQEGESITLTCNYSVGTFNGLVWYRQNPEEGPAFLFSLFSDREEKRKGRVKATLEKTNSHSSLRIIASQPRDSATYLCAVQPQCSLVTCSLYINPVAWASASRAYTYALLFLFSKGNMYIKGDCRIRKLL
uniref:Ig-like domain-containing protein n=1 Tax=Monodelphis domestica TaxID=13616 RepID=A0A5F8GM18_MONDO